MKQSSEKGRKLHPSGKEMAIDKALNGSIAILFIIALVLGYAIYVQRRPPEGTPPKPTGPIEGQNNASGSGDTTVTAPDLSDTQKAVLIVPDAGATEETKQAYFERVEKESREAPEIIIKDCLADPLVFKAKKGNIVIIKNSDDVPVTLTFGEEKSVAVDPGKTTQLLLDFVENEGIHTYHCANLPHPAGLLYMTR